MIKRLTDLRRHCDHGGPTLDQLALAELIANGAYERHLRRARRRYQQRRDRLITAVQDHLPTARITGMAAGLHLVVHLPDVHDSTKIIRTAAARGLAIASLDRYQLDRTRQTGAIALVLGYGNITVEAIDAAVRRLAMVIMDAGQVSQC